MVESSVYPCDRNCVQCGLNLFMVLGSCEALDFRVFLVISVLPSCLARPEASITQTVASWMVLILELRKIRLSFTRKNKVISASRNNVG